MKQGSLTILIGLIFLLIVGCSEKTNLQTQSKIETQSEVENSRSIQYQSEYDKKEVEECLMTYFNSINNNNMDEYNSVVKKDHLMSRATWEAMHNYIVRIKNIDIMFRKITILDGMITVPVKYNQIMTKDFIPSNLNPGENNITTDFILKQDSQGKYYITDSSSAY